MRRVLAIPSVLLLALSCLLEASSFAQPKSQPPASPPQSAQKRPGFFDYVLGKVNPSGSDYGASMQTKRDAVVASTVDDLYFWSNVVTLLLLTGTAAMVFLQWRSADKKEVIAASLIAELWNGRVSDRIEIERRTEQFNSLVERHNAEVERALAAKSSPTKGEEQTASDLKRTVEGLDKRKGRTDAQASEGTATGFPAALSGARGSEANSAGLQQKNVMLERQVEAMKNTEANLKQRLNQTMAQLEHERSRNQALKGA